MSLPTPRGPTHVLSDLPSRLMQKKISAGLFPPAVTASAGHAASSVIVADKFGDVFTLV